MAPQLVMSVNPPSLRIPPDAPPGTVVATITVAWSDGTPFTGTLGFAPPYSDDGGIFAISGDKLIINPAGPGALALNGTTRNVTVTATSETSASEHKR